MCSIIIDKNYSSCWILAGCQWAVYEFKCPHVVIVHPSLLHNFLVTLRSSPSKPWFQWWSNMWKMKWTRIKGQNAVFMFSLYMYDLELSLVSRELTVLIYISGTYRKWEFKLWLTYHTRLTTDTKLVTFLYCIFSECTGPFRGLHRPVHGQTSSSQQNRQPRGASSPLLPPGSGRRKVRTVVSSW